MNGDATAVQEQNLVNLYRARNGPRGPERAMLRAAEAIAGRLNRLIEQGHDTTAFLIALLLASTKDGLDIALDLIAVGEIPFIGQIPGFLLSATLAYFLWGKGWFNRTKIRIAYYALGLVFDNLPLVNDLPMNVLLVLWAWHVVRKRGEQAKGELEDLEKRVGAELSSAEET